MGLPDNLLKPHKVFVFGANTAGRHGGGAAKTAYRLHGAIYGVGVGLQGDSCGIPTKDKNIETLPLARVRQYVNDFIAFAKEHPELDFKVTAIGCGLVGFTNEEMAPLFVDAPDNCQFDGSMGRVAPR